MSHNNSTKEIRAEKKGKSIVVIIENIFNQLWIYEDTEDSIEGQHGQHFDEENHSRKKADKDNIFRSICIIFPSLIILTLTFLTYLGLYTVLNNMTRPVQTVTVSSEGPLAEVFPDSMGQYDILREVYRYDRAVYKHVDREDRFILFAGKINLWIIYFFLFIIHSDDTWYITSDIDGKEGELKSGLKEETFVPELGWEFFDQSYFDNNFDTCKTRLANKYWESRKQFVSF